MGDSMKDYQDQPLPVDLSDEQRIRLDRLRYFLDQAQAEYTIFVHPETVASAQQGVEQGFGELAVMAPTLVIHSEAGQMIAVISGGTRLSYKKIKRELQLKNVSLASPEMVQQITGALVGTVALINEGLPTIIDSHLTNYDLVYGGCGVPFHTLRISVKDLLCVTKAQVFDFTEPKTT